MPNIGSMIAAQRILCLKKYLVSYPASWKFLLDYYLKNVGGKFLFQCNFDYAKLPIYLPEFYIECVRTWASFDKNNPCTLENLTNQVLWNNKIICINNKSVYSRKLHEWGLNKVGDL